MTSWKSKQFGIILIEVTKYVLNSRIISDAIIKRLLIIHRIHIEKGLYDLSYNKLLWSPNKKLPDGSIFQNSLDVLNHISSKHVEDFRSIQFTRRKWFMLPPHKGRSTIVWYCDFSPHWLFVVISSLNSSTNYLKILYFLNEQQNFQGL